MRDLLRVTLSAVVVAAGGCQRKELPANTAEPTGGGQRSSDEPGRIPVSAESLNTTHRLIGPLGKPIGEVLTVGLVVEPKESKGLFEDFVTVKSVGGAALPQPVRMPVRIWTWGDIEKLTPGKTLTVRAYQDAGMMGVPDQAMRETVVVQTSSHAFETWLVILKEVDGKK